MPRSPRIFYAGAFYHVTNRGNRKTDIFRSDHDRRHFLARTAEACAQTSLRCLAYCLMTNHYHFVFRTDEPKLAEAMQWLEARYAEHFNVAYTLKGHLFQGRYRADLIDTDTYLLRAIRYVLLNPVGAGLCERAADWSWSSYAATVGLRRHTDWFDRTATLALFENGKSDAADAFTRFIAAGGPALKLPATELRRAREARDRAIYERYSTGRYSMRDLADAFGTTATTVHRAWARYAEGSDPSV
jgi:REP element-mobilizing transposase RayT